MVLTHRYLGEFSPGAWRWLSRALVVQFVGDLYKRFMVRDASERHYVNVSRIVMIVLMLLGGLAALQSESIAKVWIYLMTLGAGGAFVGLLRWYWWRVNAWAEIGAMASSVVLANGNLFCKPLASLGLLSAATMERIDWFYASDTYAIRIVFIIGICTLFWIAIMYLTPPVSIEHLERFYRRVRPGGWWGPLAHVCPDIRVASAVQGWIGWLAGTVCIYAGMFGIGYLCTGKYGLAVPAIILSVAGGKLMIDKMPREDRDQIPCSDSVTQDRPFQS